MIITAYYGFTRLNALNKDIVELNRSINHLEDTNGSAYVRDILKTSRIALEQERTTLISQMNMTDLVEL